MLRQVLGGDYSQDLNRKSDANNLVCVPARRTVPDDAVDAVAKALVSGEPCVLLLGGTAVREGGLRAASRIAAATGTRLLCETFPARLERGAQSKNFEQTNIARLVTKELEAYRYQVQKEGFQLLTRVDETVPDTLANPNALTLAFFNLLDNSVKYSGDQKQITVTVVQTNGFVDLSVKDCGLGIPRAEQQRIFEKFYRGTDPRVQKIRGSGIGLSITKHVAEMHGGQVLVDSEPGFGSTFTLRIPIREGPRRSIDVGARHGGLAV